MAEHHGPSAMAIQQGAGRHAALVEAEHIAPAQERQESAPAKPKVDGIAEHRAHPAQQQDGRPQEESLTSVGSGYEQERGARQEGASSTVFSSNEPANVMR